jgi:hypothetical protein
MNKRKFVRCKIYVDRCRMYITYLQFFMLGFMFLKIFPSIWMIVVKNIYISLPLIFIGFFVATIIIGWIEQRIGVIEAENDRQFELNPKLQEMYNILKRMDMGK